jgi:very-short-patch-repair endonuclease
MKDRKMFYGANGSTFRKASMLRTSETKAEKLLWKKLNKNQISGFRFKRQHPIGDCIADFYCHKAKLVIELDGLYHNRAEQKFHDKIRTNFLEEFQIRVIRFSDEEIFTDIERVLEVIKSNLNPIPNTSIT